MVASNQIRPVEQLLDRASDLRLRAPELALVLGERAASLAEAARSDQAWLRAESLVVFARVRLGDRASVTARTVAALRSAEHLGYSLLSARLRTDLAVCARSVGMPLTGLALLRPVLAEPGLTPGERATALCHLVGCMAQLGRKQELDRVLLEADRLCLSDENSDGDTRLVMRSLVRVSMSGHRRRHGDLTGAADAARTGLGFIEQLRDPSADGGLARARLVLQLVCTLLDRGNIEMALELAEPVLDAPPRAGVIGPASWLRLAVATRVHLSTGAPEAAGSLLREAVYDADRHGLHSLTAKLLLELAHVEERLGRPADALECLRRSRAAEQVHLRMRRQACAVLGGEFGGGEQAPVDLTDVLARSPRTAGVQETTVIPRITDSTPPPGREVARPPSAQPRRAEPYRETAQRAEVPRTQSVRVEAPGFAAEELTQTNLPRYEPQRAEAQRAEVQRADAARHEQPRQEAARYEQPGHSQAAAEAARYGQQIEAVRYQQSAAEAPRFEQTAATQYAQPAAEAPRFEQAGAAQYGQPAAEPPRFEQAGAAHYGQAGAESPRFEQGASAQHGQAAAGAPPFEQVGSAQYGQAGVEAPRFEQAGATQYVSASGEAPRFEQLPPEVARYAQPAAAPRYEQPAAEVVRYEQQPAAGATRHEQQPAAEAARYEQPPVAEAARYEQPPVVEAARYQPAGEPVRYGQPVAESGQEAPDAARYGQPAAEAARYGQPAAEAAGYVQSADAARYAQSAAEAARYGQSAAEVARYGQPAAEQVRHERPAEQGRYEQPAETGRYEPPAQPVRQKQSPARYAQAADAGRYEQVPAEPARYGPPVAEAQQAGVTQYVPAAGEAPKYELAPPPAAEPETPKAPEPQVTTRHDAEHGSVAARSVLDRLGVSSSGSGGGRRRAGDKPVEEPPSAEAVAPPEPEKPAQQQQEEGWLPKLRLPPSLAPVDEYTSDYGKPNYDLTNGDYTPPAPPADFVIPAEDPPPDAGLAELLALALAEHRAGTSSAASLVKRLGTQSDGEQAQPVNGSARRGEYDHGRRQAGGEG